MGIGKRIKEARESMGLTQTELGKKIDVTGSAITNYEKETSHPREQIIYKLMNVLNVDANYLFQDMIKSKKDFIPTLLEQDLIKKYRLLDDAGKKHVKRTIDHEIERIEILESMEEIHTIAAHSDEELSEQDRLEALQFVKEQRKKRLQERMKG